LHGGIIVFNLKTHDETICVQFVAPEKLGHSKEKFSAKVPA